MAAHHVLLMCDIVDSTALTERLGDESAATVFADHDRIARALLRTWRGREVDKSDGLFALFASADDALGFASGYHCAIASLDVPLAARAAVHAGALVLRENTADAISHGAKPLEVDGIAKPTVARLMALAGGGQTLLSAATLAGSDASALGARSLGYWRFKGMELPLEVFAVGDGAANVPADGDKAIRVERRGDIWLPVRAVAHSLPAERDEFIGRRSLLRELVGLLDAGKRQISLVGPGGSGKTRLAQRLGWASLASFPGGVWFCDLSQASSEGGIFHAVAQGLDVPLGVGDPMQQLCDAIAGRGACIVILDNFEQVARHAEATLGRWLSYAPKAPFVVTSREVLGIAGEHVLTVPAMPLVEATALFHSRAAAAVHGFEPAAAERAAIGTLVDMLDGLPLAIELAASRTRIMTPSQMLARIGERFGLLVSRGGRVERQATMRATLDWSWDLLNDVERAALAQLSLFEGGFTLEAAEAVFDLPRASGAQWAADDSVQALIEKSLVRPARGQRFELLRTVQDYARARMAEVSDATDVRRRHWQYYARLDAELGPDIPDAEVENLIAAARAAGAGGAQEASIAALAGAWSVLKRIGPFDVVADIAHGLAEAAPAPGPMGARARLVEASALGAAGRAREAIQLLRAGLADAAADAPTRARMLCSLGEMLGSTGQMAAAGDCLSQSLSLARGLGDDVLVRQALNERGAWLMRQSLLRQARSCYQEAHALAERLADRRWEGGVLGNLGLIDHMMGDAEAAREHYEAALDKFDTAAHKVWEGNTRCNLGLLHQEQRREGDARLAFERSLHIARHVGHRRLECTVLCNMGLLHDHLQQYEDAARQYRDSAAVARAIDDPRAEGQSMSYLGLALTRTGAHAEAASALDSASKLLTRVGDPISLGLLHCARYESARLRGEAAAMVDAARAARACLAQAGAGDSAELAQKIHAMDPAIAH